MKQRRARLRTLGIIPRVTYQETPQRGIEAGFDFARSSITISDVLCEGFPRGNIGPLFIASGRDSLIKGGRVWLDSTNSTSPAGSVGHLESLARIARQLGILPIERG